MIHNNNNNNMDIKQDKAEPEQQFSQIINPKGVNVDLFCKASQSLQVQSLTQFILSVQKILILYDKPGRLNPFSQLDQKNLNLIIERLKKLQNRLRFTVYELKVHTILQSIQNIGVNKNQVKQRDQDEEMKKIIINIKIEDIFINPSILNSKFAHPKQLYDFVINEVLPQVGRQILSINDHEKRYEAVLKGLDLCNQLIHPTQIQIQISKNTLLQQRVFKMRYEHAFQRTRVHFLKKAANVINEAILCPSDQKIQWLLLKILKRMYKLWGDLVYKPLYLKYRISYASLRNISLFFSQQPGSLKMLKQAAIFCYSVINSKTDIKFGDLLSSSQQLKDLKRNQFFSSKGLALPFQLGCTYDTSSLELPLWRYRMYLEKRQVYVHPIIVEKSNNLLYWKFQISNYDVGFGIYKVNLLKKYNIQQYDKGQQCKAILKLTKYGNGTANSKMPIKGQTFLKTGIYHVIFDNSYSMVRGKQLNFQICQLEALN